MYPPEIGRALVISPKKDYILKKFEPKKRPVSVLVSDWRSFQSFCQNNSSEYVARSLNSFQDAFREEVSKRISGGSFYLEFIADMAFLIIYSKKDSREEVLENTGTLLKYFSYFYRDYKEKLPYFPIYDIGCSFNDQDLLGYFPENVRLL